MWTIHAIQSTDANAAKTINVTTEIATIGRRERHPHRPADKGDKLPRKRRSIRIQNIYYFQLYSYRLITKKNYFRH